MPNDQPTVTLLLPTLNEIDGMRAILPRIDRSLFDDILVVDGGSRDGTVEYAREHGLRVMRQQRKGLSAGVLEGVCAVVTDCVVEFSMDGNCMVEQLAPLVNRLREGFDLVVVSRYLPPAKSEDDTWVTRFGNWLFTVLIRQLGRFPITDSLTIYRGFRTRLIHYPEFQRLLYGPVFEPLVSAVATARGLRIAEIPGDEPARIGGKSKMSVPYNGSCIVLMILRVAWVKLAWRLGLADRGL